MLYLYIKLPAVFGEDLRAHDQATGHLWPVPSGPSPRGPLPMLGRRLSAAIGYRCARHSGVSTVHPWSPGSVTGGLTLFPPLWPKHTPKACACGTPPSCLFCGFAYCCNVLSSRSPWCTWFNTYRTQQQWILIFALSALKHLFANERYMTLDSCTQGPTKSRTLLFLTTQCKVRNTLSLPLS